MQDPMLLKLRRPDPERKHRLKYSLSREAHARLKAASDYAMIEMSTIVEELIMRYLPAEGEERARVAPEVPFDVDELAEELKAL